MEIHVKWRLEYRKHRYIEHLNNIELEQRLKDILLNTIVLTEEAKIGLPPISAESMEWMELWTHVLEEMCIRHGPYPAGFENGFMKDFNLPHPCHGLADKAAKVVKELNFKIGEGLIKYGTAEYLKDTIEKGIVRIAPASYYSDSSLNHAIKDEELEVFVQPHPSTYKIEVIDGRTKQSKGTFQPLDNKITTRSLTDYYVYCFSPVLVPRLFVDFEADACLVITKPVIFINKLIAAFQKNMPHFISGTGIVSYIDPLRSKNKTPQPIFSKHFRYSYQQEFRLIWLPPEIKEELSFVELNVTGLKDCCKLVTLDKT